MASLGQYLRQARERRGVSLDDIARVTRIRRPHLEALEADRYGDLPAAPFVRGFLAAYAKQVGLPADDVLARYQAMGSAALPATPSPSPLPADGPSAPPGAPSPVPSRSEVGAPQSSGGPHGSRSILVLVGLVGVGALAVVGSILARPSVAPVRPVVATPPVAVPAASVVPAAEPAAPEATPAVTEAETASVAAPEATPAGPAPAVTQTPASRPVPARAEATQPTSPAVATVPERRSTLAFSATEDTWLQVTIDGGAPVEASLRPGDRVSWQGGRFDVVVGNAGGVTVEFDGVAQPPLGESGRRVSLTLPRPQAQ